MPNEKVSYSGQKVFIGIDVHKVSYSVACICDGELVRRCTMEAQKFTPKIYLSCYVE